MWPVSCRQTGKIADKAFPTRKAAFATQLCSNWEKYLLHIAWKICCFKTLSYFYVNSEFCNDFPLSTHKNYFQTFFGTLTSINPRQNSLLNWEKVALGKGLWLGHYFFADLSFCHLRPLAFGKKLIRAQSLPQKRP